jgi:DNA-binding sugar fermentation-stimulating protein
MTDKTKTFIYKIPGKLYKATILKRPSQYCKTPYVADIYIKELNKTAIAHSPSLGCGGLTDKDQTVLVSLLPKTNKKKICEYVIMLACVKEKNKTIYVGTHPKLSETIVHCALKQNKINVLQNCTNLKREQAYLNSRFDFSGNTKNNNEFILEVKSVPLSDYQDITKKERKNKDFGHYDVFNKVAYFPDGYRKNKKELISPRAFKHIQELEKISINTNIKTYLCYVIQRADANRFQTSILDPIYKNAVKKANCNGVNIIALQIKWNSIGEAILVTDNLPISL